MVDILLFSRNRAAQLELLLSSMMRNLSGDWRCVILHKNDDQHEYSYRVLQDEYLRNTRILFREQDDFAQDVLSILRNTENLMFLTDDCVFFRNVNLDHCVKKFDEQTWTVSLRLGANTTTQCYWTGQQQPNLRGYEEGDFIRWDWRNYNWAAHNFGYLTSLDASIYKSDRFLSVLPDNFNPRIPRQLEGQLVNQTFANKVAAKYPYFVAPKHSACVCISNNAVQEEPPPNGLYHPYGVEELNRMFLEGYRISYDKIDFSNINCCHTEKEFTFDKLHPTIF